MNRILADHVADNNSANGFFVLRLPEICGRKAERVIEHGGKGKKEDWSKETKSRAGQKGVREVNGYQCPESVSIFVQQLTSARQSAVFIIGRK